MTKFHCSIIYLWLGLLLSKNQLAFEKKLKYWWISQSQINQISPFPDGRLINWMANWNIGTVIQTEICQWLDLIFFFFFFWKKLQNSSLTTSYFLVKFCSKILTLTKITTKKCLPVCGINFCQPGKYAERNNFF